MEEEQILFQEKQYLGRDWTWISVRLILALFCFVAYYINWEHVVSQQLFFIVGVGILIVSIIMLYMVSYRTTVTKTHVILSGLWTTSLVKIDLNSIRKIEKGKYSNFFFNNPVYNLHKNGKIRFYSGGKEALWLTDNDGLVYVIGSQHPTQLLQAVLKAKAEK
ncbi:hypothetical protein [Sphingobacterium cellulitidis]|uniref:hypothetical protein n=1 Tax=Sphingobacterium cellulitidis TaxID=1768011 RepID=UPI000B93D0AB|nr:hypothetical protein [Sphingobacterium cellulitidis]OYD43883.1 hypothetical protein CHT99_02630 [Sphingobacterium cellulitidis]OYD47143.1 hypothetical protein CHU00_03515 [Sphingobacterium cellulitidis]